MTWTNPSASLTVNRFCCCSATISNPSTHHNIEGARPDCYCQQPPDRQTATAGKLAQLPLLQSANSTVTCMQAAKGLFSAGRLEALQCQTADCAVLTVACMTAAKGCSFESGLLAVQCPAAVCTDYCMRAGCQGLLLWGRAASSAGQG